MFGNLAHEANPIEQYILRAEVSVFILMDSYVLHSGKEDSAKAVYSLRLVGRGDIMVD